MSSKMSERLHRFRQSASGNVTMIFALSVPLLCFAVAMAVDFNNATVVHSKLNAAADAAALAALTPAMMQQSDTVASAAAVAMFKARAATIGSLVSSSTVVTANITHPNNNGNVRQVQMSYSTKNKTIFSGVLNQSTMTIPGTSTAKASVPPNIDFYLLLDNSPSMSLPATQAGINQMQTLTSKQYSGAGCAFACHQASTNNGDTAGNPCSDGSAPTQSSGQYCAATNAKSEEHSSGPAM